MSSSLSLRKITNHFMQNHLFIQLCHLGREDYRETYKEAIITLEKKIGWYIVGYSVLQQNVPYVLL
jgi:hypothetical protein